MKQDEGNKLKNSFIEIFDINGQTMNLHLFGKEKYKTFIGSIFGLISLILTLGICFYFIRDLFDRKPLSVVLNEDNDRMLMNNLTNVPIMFSVYSLLSKHIKPEGLYWYDVKLMEYKWKNINGINTFTTDIIPIDLEKCDTSKHFGDQTDLYNKNKNVNLTYHMCIPTGKYNMSLYGRYGDTLNGWSQLAVFINKCNPKMGHKCLNDTNIDITLNNVALIMYFSTYLIDHYNVDSPAQWKIHSEVLSMGTSLIKNYFLNLRQVVYETDYGYLFEEMKEENFFTYYSQELNVNLKSEGVPTAGPNIGYFVMRNAAGVSIFKRNFLKLQQVIANMGGIIKSVMILSKIFCIILTRKFIYLDIANRIFNFNDTMNEKYHNTTTMSKEKINKNKDPSSGFNTPMDTKISKDAKSNNSMIHRLASNSTKIQGSKMRK